ncbi:helix-turn-helix domain-containing protein [Halosimplex salinum]|uniref:helix-turn-helix domain-containing protein n=1 Tax=Halosimplex salinum TaxID=1710538 RepID=UPI000F47E54A|nr:helix-turn-helix domain-containing protein [Halosimplex salinum]
MKRVRITFDPPDAALPPVYELLTRGAGYLSTVDIVNWNVATPPAAFLLRLGGDYDRFESELDERGEAFPDFEWEVLPIDEAACYCFLAGEVGAAARALFENFTRDSLLTVPPVECHADGSSTFTLVGRDADVQAAVSGVPPGADVTVEEVGGERVASESVAGELSARQREAVEAALDAGYYDEPRRATVEDVAAELDCATATAAEHLRKAESTAMSALVGVRDR